MNADLTYRSFVDVIHHNPVFKFEKLDRDKRLSSLSCAFFAYAKDEHFVTFTNFDDDDTYNIRIFDDVDDEEAKDLADNPHYLTDRLANKYGLTFNDERIHMHLTKAFQNIVNQCNFIEKAYPAKYRKKFIFSLEFYFDRKTHTYHSCEYQLTFNFAHPVNSKKLTIIKTYQFNGTPDNGLAVKLFSTIDKSVMTKEQQVDSMKFLKTYKEDIPEDHGLRSHWVYVYDGRFDDELDLITHGMEVAKMNIELNEMIDYMDK